MKAESLVSKLVWLRSVMDVIWAARKKRRGWFVFCRRSKSLGNGDQAMKTEGKVHQECAKDSWLCCLGRWWVIHRV